MTFKNFLELEKKTSSGLYLDNLTGIRALAVLWVLILHTWAITGSGSVDFNIPFTTYEIGVARVIRMGEWGVDIFFVLSGFLLTTPFLRARKNVSFIEGTLDFYRRRALRLLPAYYFAILALIYFLLYGLGKLPTPAEMLQHVLLANTWFETPPLRGAFWSLPVEALFYVFLPFLIFAASRCKSFHTVFIFLIFLTIALRFIVINTPTIQSKGIFLFSFFGRMDQFSLGAIAAYFCIKHPASPGKGSIILMVSIIGMLIFISFIGRRGNLFENRDYFYYFFQTIVGIISAAMIYGAASHSKIARILFGNRVMIFIGTISYSIYLWHTIILDIFVMTNLPHGLTPDNKLVATILYTWPPILIASFLSYLFIERPFLKVRHEPENNSASFISRRPIVFLSLSAIALVALTYASQAIYQINH